MTETLPPPSLRLRSVFSFSHSGALVIPWHEAPAWCYAGNHFGMNYDSDTVNSAELAILKDIVRDASSHYAGALPTYPVWIRLCLHERVLMLIILI